MEYRDYKEKILDTVEFYSDNLKERILRDLIKQGVLTKDKQVDMLTQDALYINPQDKNNFEKCISEKPEAVKYIENWDYLRAYKYAVLFKYNDFDIDSVIQLLMKNKGITQYSETINVTDSYTYDNVYESITNPVYRKIGNRHYFKFNILRVYNDLSRIDIQYKYSMILVYHHDIKVAEIRFNSINSLKNNSNVYFGLFNSIIAWAKQYMEVDFLNFELESVINNIEGKIGKEIRNCIVFDKKSMYPNGTQAELCVGLNEDNLLPFLGELQLIIEQNQEELNQVPVLKNRLLAFMYEKEEQATDTSIRLKMDLLGIDRPDDVKFTYRYLGGDDSLLMYYGANLINGERMNDVTEFLENNRANTKKDGTGQ